MRIKPALSVAIFFAMPAFAVTPWRCPRILASVLLETAVKMGEQPYKICFYPTTWMAPFQKINGGYLIHVSPNAKGIDPDDYQPAFLRTTRKLEREQMLMHDYATYVGTYTYKSIDGFDQTIYSFQLYDGKIQ